MWLIDTGQSMEKLLFFLDTKRLGRPWNTDVRANALSGTDSVTIQTAKECFRAGLDVSLLVTAPPAEYFQKDLDIKTVRSFSHACSVARSFGRSFMVFPVSHDLAQLSEIRNEADSDVRFIAWGHNSPTLEWLNKARSVGNLHSIVMVSNGQAAYTAHHPLYKKCVVIPNFVNSDEWMEEDQAKGDNVVTYIGALCPSKGFHLLARVWPSLRAEFTSWRLVVCGSARLYGSSTQMGPNGLSDTNYEREILAPLGGSLAAASDLGVTFSGSIARAQLKAQIARSAIVAVNPTWRGSVETFCMSAVEAMCMAKPLVGGRGGALPEVIGDKIGGLLSASEAELRNNLRRLMSDARLRNTLGRGGRDRAIARYSSASTVARWESIVSAIPIGRYPYADEAAFPNTYWLRRMIAGLVPVELLDQVRSVKRRVS
jgi:glycosyltransferase involved in cell wall biosynthesis